MHAVISVHSGQAISEWFDAVVSCGHDDLSGLVNKSPMPFQLDWGQRLLEIAYPIESSFDDQTTTFVTETPAAYVLTYAFTAVHIHRSQSFGEDPGTGEFGRDQGMAFPADIAPQPLPQKRSSTFAEP